MLLWVFILMVAAFYFIFLHFKNRHFSKLFDKIPSPPSVPILGHVLNFKNMDEMLDALSSTLEENNGITAIRLGPWIKFVFVSDRELVATLCTTKHVQKSTFYKLFENWLGKIIFTTEGKTWKRYRNLLMPTMHSMATYHSIRCFTGTATVLIKKLEAEVGKSFDVYKYIELNALDSVFEVAIGISINAQKNEGSEYVTNMHEMLRILAERMSNPLKYDQYLYRLSRDYWKERKTVKYLKKHTKSLFESKLRTKTNKTSEEDRRKLNFLDTLIEQRGTELKDEEICNHIEGSLFAGHDTAATAMSCTLYLLSVHDDVQEKAYSEIRQICGDDKFRSFTLEDLQEMKYLEMVIKESMRLYPPAPLIGKFTLDDIECGGHVIPKDVDVLIFIDHIQRREKYFSNPHVFDPERFSPENQTKVKPFTYMPFGAGTRTCIGQKLAMVAMKMTLSMILRSYKILPVDGFQMKMFSTFVQKPGIEGIQISIQHRE